MFKCCRHLLLTTSVHQIIMSSLKALMRGPCSLCGEQASSKCPNCHTLYCSRTCQKNHWREHKIVCQSTSRGPGVSFPEQTDCDQAVQNATHRKDMFEAQMLLYRIGHQEHPTICIGTHQNLHRKMSHTWLAAMNEWADKAHDDLVQMLDDSKIKWTITRIGSVITEIHLNTKDTRLQLYLPDKTKPQSWTIVMEPLHYGGPDDPFNEPKL